MMESPSNDLLTIPDGQAAEITHKPDRKKYWGGMFLRMVSSLLIIALGIVVLLYCGAKAGQFDSVQALCEHLVTELALMWQRIVT